MADIAELEFVGDWRIVVESQDAAWAQRVVVDSTETGTATVGGVGGHLDVYGQGQTPWRLRIQHDPSTGWQDSWVRLGARTQTATSIVQVVESEDKTTPASDRDFNDLVIRLEKLGMADQPTKPFAVWPTTLQMMPEGVFEASLGRYLLAVRVRNVFTAAWPGDAVVSLSQRCRQWLAAAGVQVIDAWSAEDAASVGQEVVAGGVRLGALSPWESRLVYFKVDVSAAPAEKLNVEIQVVRPQAEDLTHLNKRARAPMMISRTSYDTTRGVFVSECDRGTLTAVVREVAVDYNTLKRAVTNARKLLRGEGEGAGGGPTGPQGRCSPRDLERIQARLRAFLEGKDVDICEIWRDLQRCCCGGGRAGGDDGSWVGEGVTGLEFFVFPTSVDYRVEYAVPFAGQFGPIPYDDPWWKVLLLIIAIILAIAAAISAAADLANRSDDVVIGTLTRTILNSLAAAPATPPAPSDPGLVDVAVTTLNGRRTLTSAMFSYLDAASDEVNTTPIVALGGRIDTAGVALTNAQLNLIFQNIATNPSDPAAIAATLLFKSGARTGVTLAVLSGLMPISPRTNGTTIFFLNQLLILPDPMAPTGVSRPGDSGSLWLQRGTNAVVGLNHAGAFDPSATPPSNFAVACRIEDVMNTIGVRFA